ncbi:hypothetical protein, partial [Atlantibacter hermannii]|uniref:hypothetical protein n=1 Tax=Atlantibacter hermannii TaxID=565 RepID=UPI0034D49661
NVVLSSATYKAYSETAGIKAHYRDTSGTNSSTETVQADTMKFDLTYGFSEQILSGSVRFKLGDSTFFDRDGLIYRDINPSNGSCIQSGLIRLGTGEIELSSWTPGQANSLTLESLITTTDLPPINKISFRTP